MAGAPVALVTGCGKYDGMGRAIALALANSGHRVVVTDRVPDGVPNTRGVARAHSGWCGIESLVEELRALGAEATGLLGDISHHEEARALVDGAVSEFGRLDVLVNNAAAPQGADRVDVEQITADDWHRQISVNLTGTFLMCQAAVSPMRRQRFGRIVNISSMAGIDASPHSVAYSASKAGVIGLTRSLAMDVGPWGITVNAICPGLVDTSRAGLTARTAEERAANLERLSGRIAVGRAGAPADVGALTAFLASEGAGYVTAQAIPLDGGGVSPFPLTFPQ
ncbi:MULTISPECIES: SDR family NAD(P)-dependent oxidoreductase [unclassified Microbacterium]|uniref:SDR family NAD(P)-dependent oxidoreductase n=1 Tax=unclassified Microbacterium TaxID=2609290 RepID=UPI00214CA761|nr:MULTISPECIES: SDR family NAD(P)-dependent oxidoreductase [unclassified Microbacterium]MCR2808408.1 SDR family oxidoreductase [Microbacterium sp. zg.B185]WIM19146.1 SDR family NAD(P)-dependent oxidoreductase [Microbacterium sp. zg-B185]